MPRLRKGVIRQGARIQVLLFLLLQSGPGLSPVLIVIPFLFKSTEHPGVVVQACLRPLKGHAKTALVCIKQMSWDPQSIRNVVQNGLAISGSANREESLVKR